MRVVKSVLGLLLFALLPISLLQAQETPHLIQLSGIVVSGEDALGVPGAFIYSPKTGRGASTNYIGFFSMPAKTGDTLLVKAIGFSLQRYIVPEVAEKTTVAISIREDMMNLPMVEVFPWPTEKIFKEAFLALDLDQSKRNNINQNLNDMVIRRMLLNLKDDGSMNHKYFINQQYMQTAGAGVQTFGLFNPFAWKRFIQDSKKGQLQQQEDRYRDPKED